MLKLNQSAINNESGKRGPLRYILPSSATAPAPAKLAVSANSKHVQIEPKLVQLGHILVQSVPKMG